nr:cyclin-dependent kinase F-4 [Tanacetum cinerariifolium]
MCKAVGKETCKPVVVKKLMTKYDSWEECMNLTEFKALKKMNNHPNIVKVKEIIKRLLVHGFRYMECSLSQVMPQQENPFSETTSRYLCFQIFQGLVYRHHKGYFHHDLKMDNLLVNNGAIKISDLGSARKVNGHPLYIDIITKHCYRSPEREFLKETRNLEMKSFSSCSKGEDLTEDMIHMNQFLPRNPFDFSKQDVIDFLPEHPFDFEDSMADIVRFLPEHPFEDVIEDMIHLMQFDV